MMCHLVDDSFVVSNAFYLLDFSSTTRFFTFFAGESRPYPDFKSIAKKTAERLLSKESFELPVSSLPKTFTLPMGKQIGIFLYFWSFGPADLLLRNAVMKRVLGGRLLDEKNLRSRPKAGNAVYHGSPTWVGCVRKAA